MTKRYRDRKSFNDSTSNATSDPGTEATPNESDALTKCPQCGKEVKPKASDGKQVCPECGADLKMPVKTFTAEERQKLAKEGKAKPDGSYPIVTRGDLEDAIRAWGRGGATASDKEWITKRAKELKATDLLPEDWAGSTAKKPDATKTAFVSFGDSLKTLDDAKDGLVPVGGYLILYGDPSRPDLTGDYFTPKTNFGSATKTDMWLHHTLPIQYRDVDGSVKSARVTRQFKSGELTKDKIGVYLKSMLDERDEYDAMVLKMVRAGKINLSSGVPDHLIEGEIKTNGTREITQWILGADASYDHTPAEPRNVMAIQSLKTFIVDSLPKDEASRGTVAGSSVKTDSTKTNMEDKMTEEEKKALEEKVKAQEAIIAAQSENIKTLMTDHDALKTDYTALKTKLEAEPPRASGVKVDPEQKLPYKSFRKNKAGYVIDASGYGEYLIDVMTASHPNHSVSTRLAAVEDIGIKSFKAIQGLNAQIPSQGGFFVQTDHSAELVRNMFEQGKILSGIRKTPLGPGADGVTLNGVDETTRVTTLWGGILPYWLAEGDAATAAKPKFREIKLEVKGLGALYYATDKILKIPPALGMDVAQGFRGAMTYFVAEAIINGTGAGTPLGLMSTPLVASGGSTISVAKESNQPDTTITYNNILAMWARMFPECQANAIWLANIDTSPQLNALYLTTGLAGIPAQFIGYGNDGVLRMMGRPVVFTEHCLTLGALGDLILWDPSTYRFADLGDVEEATSIHVEFLTAQTVFRYLYYCDGQPQLAKSLTPKHGSNTLSTQVTLAARP